MGMMTPEKSRHIFHSINARRNAQDQLDYLGFCAALLKLCQSDLTMLKAIPTMKDRITVLMCYLRDVACRVELELKLFPDLGKQILERSHRMGSVSLWESPGTPMIDIVYIVPTTINTGKELVQSSVGICL